MATSDEAYHTAYNTLSTAATGAIVYGWFKHVRGAGPLRQWAVPSMHAIGAFKIRASGPRAAAAIALQATGLALISQYAPAVQMPIAYGEETARAGPALQRAQTPEPKTLGVRCPFDFQPADLPDDGVGGVARVTRHPALWALGLCSLGAAVASPLLPEACFLAMPALVALALGEHQDYRYRRGIGGELPPALDARTSNVPFLALATGVQEGTWTRGWEALADELKLGNAGIALVLAAAMHARRVRTLPAEAVAKLVRL
eukprot:g5907.t1